MAKSKHTLEIAEHALSLIEDYDHWCSGTFARDNQGRAIAVSEDDAVSFCAVGAGEHAAAVFLKKPHLTGWRTALERTALEMYGKSVVSINDGEHGTHKKSRERHEKVVAVYRRLVEKERATLEELELSKPGDVAL